MNPLKGKQMKSFGKFLGLGCLGMIAVMILVVIIVGSWFISTYNTQISNDEICIEKWGNVESSYQRRADLIPGLVKTAAGYMGHENETLTQVAEARASVNQINLDLKGVENLNSQQMAQMQAAQENLGSALSRLLVTVERYPDLKANQQFNTLMIQLEGTENRINVARNYYNESVRISNTGVRTFLGQFVAGFSGVNERTSFEADQGAEDAPEVNFD